MKKETLLPVSIFTFTLLLINPLSSADEKVLIRANNEFASRFYKVLSESTEDNFIFCPLCLSAGMAMLSVGGNQRIAEQIQSVMGFPANESILLNGYKNLIHTFKNQFKATRLMFNGIFLSKNITLNPDYEEKLVKYFQTSPKVLTSVGGDKDEEIEKVIENELNDNSFDTSEEQSRNGTPQKDETTVENETSFVLANFLKFKAGWEKRFETSGTTQEPFYVNKDEILHVKMMRQTGHFHIVSIPQLESRAIALPYLICDGSTIFQNFTMPKNNNNSTQRTKSRKKKACKSGVKDSRLQLIVLLPNDNTGLKILEEKLSADTLLEIPRTFDYKTYLDLSIPSFELTSREDLFNLTSKIGLESLASPDRNSFDNISKNEKLTLTSIFHRVSLTVEEKGSKTKSSHLRGASPGKNPKLVKIDHPFLAFVHDKKLDVILMVLKVVRPM